MIRQASLDATLSSTLFAEQTLPTRPSFSPRLLVWLFCIRSLAGAHEGVASAMIAHEVVGLDAGLHLRVGVWFHVYDSGDLVSIHVIVMRLYVQYVCFLR